VSTHRVIEDKLDECERKALDSLSGYKFSMFGYWAGQWVAINKLLLPAERRKNPFRDLVLRAREMREARKEAA